MSACPSIESLRNWLQDHGAVGAGLAIDAHLETCRSCQAAVGRLLASPEVTGSGPAIAPAPPPREELLRRLEALRTAPVQVLAPTPGLTPLQIDGCEVLGELSRGGMGVVYLARQDALKRLVAIKVLLAGGHAGEEELARFRTEAEAIARLQHPNIVPVYQIGECEGRPFLCLEYAEGGSLDRRLAGVPQPPAEAAALIEVLARAVHYAHEQGIVHRDLKPANVLLTADGTPKVTDFGLAKKLDEASQTQTGAVMGTPSYMAPEQARGEKGIGPAADVYALGAIFYECLTGRPPFKAATALETLEQVATQEPVAPRQLNAQVPRDLETIALKCLRKELARRYASADELARDLRRYQAGEPIQARPVGAVERLLRRCRRSPVVTALVGLVALLALALALGGPALALRERRAREQAELNEESAAQSAAEANRQRDRAVEAERVARANLTQAEANLKLAKEAVDGCYGIAKDHPLLNGPLLSADLHQLKRLLLEKALPFYQQFRARRPGDGGAARDEVDQLSSIGSIHYDLGSHWEALTNFQRAAQLARALVKLRPGEPSLSGDLAAALTGAGMVLQGLGRFEEAARSYAEAVELRRGQVRIGKELAEAQNELARSLTGLGNVQQRLGRPREAVKSYAEAIETRRNLIRSFPAVPDYRNQLALTLNNQSVLQRDLDLRDEALRGVTEATRLYRELVNASPETVEYRDGLGRALMNLALLQQDRGDPRRAARSFTEAIELRRAVVQAQPAVPEYRNDLAGTLTNYAFTLRALGQFREALQAYGEGIEMRRAVVQAQPGVAEFRQDLARSLTALGNFQREHGLGEDAVRSFTEAITHFRALVRARPEAQAYRFELTRPLGGLAILLRNLGRVEESRRCLDASLHLLAGLKRERATFPDLELFRFFAHRERARAFAVSGKFSEAVRDWGQALALAPPSERASSRVERALALALADEHDRAAAEAEALLRLPQVPAVVVYDSAIVLALSAAGARRELRTPLPTRERVVEARSRRAVTLIRGLGQAGFFLNPRFRAHLEQNRSLDLLRDRDDFKQVLAGLSGN